jgi:hypothetical protein
MPWAQRRAVYLLLLSVAALAIAVVVWVLNQDVSTDLLAAGLVAGGLAMVLVALPDAKDGGT